MPLAELHNPHHVELPLLRPCHVEEVESLRELTDELFVYVAVFSGKEQALYMLTDDPCAYLCKVEA